MIMRTGAALRWSALAGLFVVLVACAATPQTDQLPRQFSTGLPERHIIKDVPFFPQQQYQCGPAALSSVLNYAQLQIHPDQLVSQVYIPERQGSLQVEMLAASRQLGRLPFIIPGTLRAVITELAADNPVLVFQNLGLSIFPQWHYAVVIGYDMARRELILHSGLTENYVVSMRTFERTWQRAGHWAMLTLAPGQLPVSMLAADYFRTVAEFEALHSDSAEMAWRAGYKRWPDDPLIAMGYSNWLAAAGHTSRAIEILQELLATHPDYGPAQQNLQVLQSPDASDL
ncbi:PA2778 family cysteine peptidase [Pseudohongiella spirulinae]|uniref:Bacteriocin/lantibiotic ABC transporter n=1 Tax=Pseudohongiella spirulinae TaxID=1249552 RepID=A0A0S2KG03_9GAMM|nr:PA2778 family cysteine peptidase [Pseudohongiella spirulinae]ALO47271.1 bacteriocin/lantibiotic ABC transporter [Pseudohongiella spirulinae]